MHVHVFLCGPVYVHIHVWKLNKSFLLTLKRLSFLFTYFFHVSIIPLLSLLGLVLKAYKCKKEVITATTVQEMLVFHREHHKAR